MPRSLFFTVGGTVQASGGTYIERTVDKDLLDYCLAGEFAFVLTARQMGKSSLMVRTAESLRAQSVRSVIIDLSQIGVQISEDAWYLGFLTVIEDALDLDTDVFDWWDDKQHLGYGQRMTQFFQDVVLKEVEGNIVIFVDEIDSTLSLPFTDDFFTTIRGVYNSRSSHPELKRLTFALIGVATPSDLVSDPSRTPFNIGRQVEVSYFTKEEAAPLARGFGSDEATSNRLLGLVMDWTNGHPYLTQRLSSIVAHEDVSSITSKDVDRLVRDTFFDDNAESDSNLRFVHDMLTRRAEDPTAVLTTYRDILKGKSVKDDRHSHPITHLKLSGIVGRVGNKLEIKNKIYRTVFDEKWLAGQWPEHWLKRVPLAVRGLVAASFVAVIFMGMLAFQIQQNNQAASEAELQAQILTQTQRSDAQNAALADSLQISLTEADRLRTLSEDARAQLAVQFDRVDALNRDIQSNNVQLAEQFRVADSLSAETQQANRDLADQIQIADSLRTEAERLLQESVQARTETLIIALADAARRQTRLGDPALGALLARQAHAFSQSTGNTYEDPVYDALVEALNEMTPAGGQGLAGPVVIPSSGGAVLATAMNESGEILAMGSEAGRVEVYVAQSQSVRLLDAIDLAGSVTEINLLSDNRLVVGSDDGSLHVASTSDSGEFTSNRLVRMDGSVHSVDVAPDEASVIAGDADGNAVHISLDDASALEQINVGSKIRDIAFGSWNSAVLALEDGQIVIWTFGQGETARWDAGQGRLHSVTYDPTGSYIVSGGDSTMVKQWTPDGTTYAASYRGHEGPVNDLAFSTDGRRMASASSDHSIQVWKLDQPGSDPIILQDHTSWVYSVAFSSDGSKVLSSANDRTARLFNIDSAELADRVCSATAGRTMTTGEWDRFVGVDFDMGEFESRCPQTRASQ